MFLYSRNIIQLFFSLLLFFSIKIISYGIKNSKLFNSIISKCYFGAHYRDGSGIKIGPNIKTTKRFFLDIFSLLIILGSLIDIVVVKNTNTFIKSTQIYSSSLNYHRPIWGLSSRRPSWFAPPGHTTLLLFEIDFYSVKTMDLIIILGFLSYNIFSQCFLKAVCFVKLKSRITTWFGCCRKTVYKNPIYIRLRLMDECLTVCVWGGGRKHKLTSIQVRYYVYPATAE